MLRFVFCVISLTAFATTNKEEEICPKGKSHYRGTIRHIERGGIGYEDGYTTFETFIAADPSKWIVTPFLDAKGHIFDHGKWAANVGVGLRTLFGNRAYGINTYYDYRNTGKFHSNQIGIGLETLGKLFDCRINGYFPVGRKISEPYSPLFKAFLGNSMLISQKYKSAMKGADGELGFHLGKSTVFDFYAAIGPYYFVGERAPATWGGKARISGTYKNLLTLEISDSYDRTFHNKFQGQISLRFSFGPKSKIKKKGRTCEMARALNDRMVQTVGRQEIIVVDKIKETSVAIDPATGLPYFFVFINNTSSSDGTYESPYHSLAQAQNNASPGNILYLFPGDGTTKGMDSGILLQANQKFWGSGINHLIETTAGVISIPAHSSSSPTITNTNIDTEGNAITLATNNAISGLIITSAMNDAIYGTDPQNLDVSFCTIQNTNTYAIEATFLGNAGVSLTNNQFLDNVNGVFLNLNGTTNVVCSDNTFKGQTSVSSVPLEIVASENLFTTDIQNNLFQDNITGSIRFNLANVDSADIRVLNNTMKNNGTGSQASLGSSCVILSNGTIEDCSIDLTGNTFSENTSNSLYLHTSGLFTTLAITASTNTMSNNGGSSLVLATPAETLTLDATDNTITSCNDNGIAIIASGTSSSGKITIKNNTITDIGNSSNGIAVNQDFTTLNLTIQDNEILRCEGTGIVSYAPTGIDSFSLNISGNTISDCQNLSSNAASGIDIEQYTILEGSLHTNVLSNNIAQSLLIGSTLPGPTVCLSLIDNTSSDYSLINPVDGVFNLSPCNVDVVNTGTINTSGTVTLVQSCPDGTACP